MGKRMRIISLHLPEKYFKCLQELVDRKMYPNVSEAIRIAVRDLLIAHKLLFNKNQEAEG